MYVEDANRALRFAGLSHTQDHLTAPNGARVPIFAEHRSDDVVERAIRYLMIGSHAHRFGDPCLP